MEKGTYTFAMIKPHAVKEGKTGDIISLIEKAGYRIEKMEMDQMDIEDAQVFYEVHSDKPFYEKMCEIMSESSVIAMVLTKPSGSNNIVEDFRNLVGATNPANANANTIRKLFGTSLDHNAIHASDSEDNAEEEAEFFFYMGDDYDDEFCDSEDECCGKGCH